MIVSSIAAMASNRVIGKNGDLPWKIPQDMKFFRDMTMGKIMLMGRKTFESLGKPLPGRLHVVVTRQKDYQTKGAHVFHDFQEALEFCQCLAEQESSQWGEEIFVVGGGEIYREALSQTDRIYLTEIKAEVPGDTYFPDFDKNLFREVWRRAGEGPVAFDFVLYERTRSEDGN